MEGVAELIADMVRAGVDADLIGRTAAILSATGESSRGDGDRSAAALRQARYRERIKEREVVTRDVTLRNGDACDVTRDDAVSLSPVPPSSPPHPPNNPLTPKPIHKTNSRGTRLPDDWQLTGPDLAYALSKGLTEAETADLAERFKSWALSASGPNAVKRNWHQAFQGWVQRDGPKIIAARAGPRGGFAKPVTEFQRKQQETKDVLDGLKDFVRRGGGRGAENPQLLRDHSGERPESLFGRDGGNAVDV